MKTDTFHIRRAYRLCAILLIALAVTGCAETKPTTQGDAITLDFFAVDEAFEVAVTVAHRYRATYPGVEVRITYDEGAVLAAMIEAGYRCDVYLCDDPSYLDWLDGQKEQSSNPNGNDLLVEGSRLDLLQRVLPAVEPGEGIEAGEQAEVTVFSVAVINTSPHPGEAQKFIEFLLDGSCDSVYEEYDFSRI